MLNVGPIAQRVMGTYPLSIATSLAIEGALGNHPDKPTGKNQLKDFNVIWVNVKTLFRNFHNSIDKNDVYTLRPQEIFNGFSEEVDNFKSVIKDVTDSKMKVIFYVNDYLALERTYPKAVIRLDTTKLQQAYTNMMLDIVGGWVKENIGDVQMFRTKMSVSEQGKALMLTHIAYDLLSKGFYTKALLESHTGVIKSKYEWYTKYHNGKELQMIPFREDFLQIFGDDTLFRPLGIQVRKAIVETALEYHWSQTTTTDKIKYSIRQMKNKFLVDQLMLIIKS